jgi:hypothetical protein
LYPESIAIQRRHFLVDFPTGAALLKDCEIMPMEMHWMGRWDEEPLAIGWNVIRRSDQQPDPLIFVVVSGDDIKIFWPLLLVEVENRRLGEINAERGEMDVPTHLPDLC